MRLGRTIFTITLALGLLCTAGAQEQKGFIGRTIDKLIAPSRELDPNAVYQPAPRWTFALTGDLRQAGIGQTQEFVIGVAKIENDQFVDVEEVPSSITSTLTGDVNKAIGFQAGYGSLSLAWSKNLSKKGTEKVFAFDYLSAGYALQAQFFNLSDIVSYEQVIADPSHWAYSDEEAFTEKPGQMRAFILDGFYAFNRRTFAYSAAYKGNLFQKHNAGSWMFGSKLILGEFAVDPDEIITQWTGGSSRQTSAQVSFGGGYSYNFVPLHKQPYADRDKGLRNLTINLTFLPMVTLFNQFTASTYGLNEDQEYMVIHKDVMNGTLLVNYVARFGIGYSHDLFTVNLSASADSFAYKGTSTIPSLGVFYNKVDNTGFFIRWMVALRLGMRF